MSLRVLTIVSAIALLGLAGCKTVKPYDYTNFRAHPPRSILVLPPINQSTNVQGTYGYLSTVTAPVAERGYYVFPVEVVDQFLKENGMPTAGEMHQVPLNKVAEITGADAVLFVTLEKYGSQYRVLDTATVVRARATLVDTRTGLLLWEGRGAAEESTSDSGDLIADLIAAAVAQAIHSKTDPAHHVSRQANEKLFNAKNAGLPFGPYSPQYAKGY